jgi:lysophospholipid acyltransferase (LPLAT)-like uncharacterized protein
MATPQFIKNISRNRLARAAACLAAALLIRTVWATSRWRVIRAPGLERIWNSDKPFIVCFWHGRLMMMSFAWTRSQNFNMLISSHADGRLIAGTVARLGINTVAGSSSQGGAGALRSLVQILKGGNSVGITPDGPRGPRMRASTGAIALARLSGAPMVPLAFSCRRRRIWNSWDRFVLAWPFTSGVFMWGEPIEVPGDADAAMLDALQSNLEERMNSLTVEADRHCGHEPIDPAPSKLEPGP